MHEMLVVCNQVLIEYSEQNAYYRYYRQSKDLSEFPTMLTETHQRVYASYGLENIDHVTKYSTSEWKHIIVINGHLKKK